MYDTISLFNISINQLKEYSKSELIFREGARGLYMYFIYSGKVRLYTDAPGYEISLAMMGPGEFFGEMALIDSFPRTATAVAEEDTKLITIDEAGLKKLLKSHSDFAYLLIQKYCGLLRARWDLFNELKKSGIKNGQLKLVLKSEKNEEIDNIFNFLHTKILKEKRNSEAMVLNNVKEFIFPYIDRLRASGMNPMQEEYISIIENNLKNILSPFLNNLPSNYSNFTPMEIKVANLIKDGKTSKEISQVLNVSTQTVDFHRNNIRSKLDIKNKQVGLRAYLLTLSKSE